MGVSVCVFEERLRQTVKHMSLSGRGHLANLAAAFVRRAAQ